MEFALAIRELAQYLLHMMSAHWGKSVFKSLAKFTILAFFSIWSFSSFFSINATAAQWIKTISKNDSQIPDGTVVLKDVPYVTNGHERQKLDLLLPPSEEKLPLLVWVHGGGWEAGDKAERTFYRFLNQGFAVASINYRFSQHAIYPAQIEDCKAAIRWLRAHAEEFGFDAEKMGAGGASAGGHLVALLAATGHTRMFDKGEYLEESSRIQAACDFFGPTDFNDYDFQDTIFKDYDNSPLSKLVGGSMAQKTALRSLASPLCFVTSTHAPIIIIHGNRDNLVPLNQSQRYLGALAQVNVESTLLIIDNQGHGFDGENYWREISTFFEKKLKPEKRVGYTKLLLIP